MSQVIAKKCAADMSSKSLFVLMKYKDQNICLIDHTITEIQKI